MTTTVVNIRGRRPDEYDVYIGRANGHYRLPESKWHNPFKPGQDGTLEEVIAKHRAYLLASPELLADIGSLKGKRLGCWCKPAACHGDLLAELADMERNGGEPTA